MAESYIKKIKREPNNKDIVEYLDYLAETLSHRFENIDEENLTDSLKKKITNNAESAYPTTAPRSPSL